MKNSFGWKLKSRPCENSLAEYLMETLRHKNLFQPTVNYLNRLHLSNRRATGNSGQYPGMRGLLHRFSNQPEN